MEGVDDVGRSENSRTSSVEIPVFYGDPWTHETRCAFAKSPGPERSDLDYAARIKWDDGTPGVNRRPLGSPWSLSMVGFVAGCPSWYQMVERARQIEAPQISPPAHRYAETHGRPWRLLGCTIRCAARRLPVVRSRRADYDPRQRSASQGFMIS